MDLFVVPTISFRLLYGLLIMGHGRRQILWFGVTAHPTAEARAFSSATFHGSLSAAYHSVPTGPILGMRERPHGLAAQPFTGARKTRRREPAGLIADQRS
jgi:hypothetical protein